LRKRDHDDTGRTVIRLRIQLQAYYAIYELQHWNESLPKEDDSGSERLLFEKNQPRALTSRIYPKSSSVDCARGFCNE
jgi:hypothetical protein